MSPSLFSRFVLVLSGLTALFVSLSVLFDPLPFYRGYGIEAGASPGLLNELKAPAGSLLFAGILALLGAAWPWVSREHWGFRASGSVFSQTPPGREHDVSRPKTRFRSEPLLEEPQPAVPGGLGFAAG